MGPAGLHGASTLMVGVWAADLRSSAAGCVAHGSGPTHTGFRLGVVGQLGGAQRSAAAQPD